MSEPTPSGGARVTLDPPDSDDVGHDLVVEGHGLISKPKHMCFVAPEAVLAPADVESLAAAVQDKRRCCFESSERILIATVAPDRFDEAVFPSDEIHLEVDEDGVEACMSTIDAARVSSELDYERVLAQAAWEHQCVISSVRLTNEYGDALGEDDGDLWPPEYEAERQAWLDAEGRRPKLVEVRVAPSSPMRVEQLVAAGRDVYALLTAIKDGPLGAATAARLARSGLPHLLLGLAEGEWLEVKGQPYDLRAPSPHAKIELAQDIARFANGDKTALLIVGIATRKTDSGDEILAEMRPAKLSSLMTEQYRSTIDARVFPPIEGLRIDRVDTGGGRGILVIEVPAQPREFQPFLVHGAIVGDRVEGAFISIVRRRGEGSTTLTASQIHAALAAGNALLRSNQADPS